MLAAKVTCLYAGVMALDLRKFDKEIDPFMRSLGDRFFRNVDPAKRQNVSSNPADAQTETDLACEMAVCEFLRGISDFPILSEESAKLDKSRDVFRQAPAYWICDPIDGTTHFQRLGYGEFGTLLSLVEEGQITGAWGYFPGAAKENDVLAKSTAPDEVFIDGVPSVVFARATDDLEGIVGRFKLSKHATYVTEQERAQFDINKGIAGITAQAHIPGHSTLKFARGRMDYFAHVGSHPWDFTVMGKFVTALGGQVYKFDETQSARRFEDDAILDAEMVIALTMPGIDYNAVIGPLFKNTRWEKTCLLPPAM